MRVKLNGANDTEAVRKRGRAGQTAADEVGRRSPAAGVNASSPADTLKVTDRTSQIAKLADRAKDLPEVRSERVEALRTAIASREFDPPAELIADRILTSRD